MLLTPSNKTWIIGIIIMLLALSIFSSFSEYQNAQPNYANLPCFLNPTNISNVAIIFKEQHSNYLAFFLKPFKLLIATAKYLHLVHFKSTASRWIATQNLNIATSVISLFAIYYQLSRSASEKPDLRFGRLNLAKPNYRRSKNVNFSYYHPSGYRLAYLWRDGLLHLL